MGKLFCFFFLLFFFFLPVRRVDHLPLFLHTNRAVRVKASGLMHVLHVFLLSLSKHNKQTADIAFSPGETSVAAEGFPPSLVPEEGVLELCRLGGRKWCSPLAAVCVLSVTVENASLRPIYGHVVNTHSLSERAAGEGRCGVSVYPAISFLHFDRLINTDELFDWCMNFYPSNLSFCCRFPSEEVRSRATKAGYKRVEKFMGKNIVRSRIQTRKR